MAEIPQINKGQRLESWIRSADLTILINIQCVMDTLNKGYILNFNSSIAYLACTMYHGGSVLAVINLL